MTAVIWILVIVAFVLVFFCFWLSSRLRSLEAWAEGLNCDIDEVMPHER